MCVTAAEFRVGLIRDGQAIAFFPSDADGNRRDGTVWGLEEGDAAAQIAKKWLPTDRIFYYFDVQGAEGGYFNDRTKEKLRI